MSGPSPSQGPPSKPGNPSGATLAGRRGFAKAKTVTVDELGVGGIGKVGSVAGDRHFRRRLLELGLVPGTFVKIIRLAPLGDPWELEVRGGRISIRREEARRVEVTRVLDEKS